MDTQRPLNWLAYTLKTEFYFNSKQTRKNNCLDTSQNCPCLFRKKKKKETKTNSYLPAFSLLLAGLEWVHLKEEWLGLTPFCSLIPSHFA